MSKFELFYCVKCERKTDHKVKRLPIMTSKDSKVTCIHCGTIKYRTIK